MGVENGRSQGGCMLSKYRYRTQLRSALKRIDLYVIRWGARRTSKRLNPELLEITTGGAKGTEHTLRLNPELRELAPLPDLDDVRMVTEVEPAPAPRFTFKPCSASPLFVMALMVVAIAVVVAMVERTYANASNPEAAANAIPGGSGNGLMVAGGNGLTGKSYPLKVLPQGEVIWPLLYLTEVDRILERQTDQFHFCKRRFTFANNGAGK
jgi:hypothetical protein